MEWSGVEGPILYIIYITKCSQLGVEIEDGPHKSEKGPIFVSGFFLWSINISNFYSFIITFVMVS